MGFQPWLERTQEFLPDIWRVAHHNIKAALGENLGKCRRPVKGLGMHRRITDDAVALANGVVETGQLFAPRGGLDPQAKLADPGGTKLRRATRASLRPRG